MFWNSLHASSTRPTPAILHRQQQLHQVRANREVRPSPVITNASKSATCRLAGFSVCVISETMSSPSAFIFECKLNRRHAIAQVDHRRARILAHHSARLLDRRRLAVPSGSTTGLYAPLAGSKYSRPEATPASSL
jgi:hypothetical protein